MLYFQDILHVFEIYCDMLFTCKSLNEIQIMKGFHFYVSRLQLKRVKGGGQFGKLCYCPKASVDERFFRPTGIHIIRTVKGQSYL